MEIKELVPKSKEIIIQPKPKDTSCSAFSYSISASGGPAAGGQKLNKNGNGKKYLYIVSQIQSGDQSLDYVPNLIASFMKRELEGEDGSQGESLFEKSLKKTNELIEGLLKENSGLRLDLGIAFINKERMAVSKIGKAKMLAYRTKTGDIFDVFENTAQFSKSPANYKRFSNMISGEVKKDDKFFFFIPNARLNLKQKTISATLCKNDQDAFFENLRKITAPEENKDKKERTAPGCCGIHLEIKEELKKVALENSGEETPPGFAEKEKKSPIVATEVAKINRNDILKRTTEKFKGMIMGNNNSDNRNWRLIKPRGISNYFIVAVIALVVIAGLGLFTRSNPKLKEALTSINEKLRAGESRLLLKQNLEARKFLDEAFAELGALQENKEKEKAYLAAAGLLNRIERVNSSVKPVPLIDLARYQNIDPNEFKNILAADGKIFVNDSGKIYGVGENELKPLEESGGISLSWIKGNKIITYQNSIKIINLDENKIKEIKKKFNFEPIELKNYEDNLYFLGAKNIYKITNALLNPRGELEWLKPAETAKIAGNFVSFDLDSNVYILTDERKLVVMFKGEVVKTVDLDFNIRPGMELVNLGNKELLALDKEKRLARLINDSGELKVSYDLSDIDGVKDAFFDKETRILYLLSPAKIWSLKI